MLKRAGLILALLFAFAGFSFGQDGHFDASFGGAPIFTKGSSAGTVSQSATSGLNVFGTIRLKFKPRHSFVFNYGHAKDSQVYQTVGDNFHILDTISEYSGAYMFSPFRKGKFEPFVLAGGGVLRFYPRSTWLFLPPINQQPDNIQLSLNAATQSEIAFLYGFGVDYRLPVIPRFALRLQYRGFLYRQPDFKIDSSTGSAISFFTGTYGHMAEPSVGLVFRF
jgi:outer membrane immunogenic protein